MINVSKPTAKLIKDTYTMVHRMQERSSSLISTYRNLQGSPFSDEGFTIPDIQVINIPQARIPHLEWLGLSDADRLTQNFIAYHIMFKFLEHTLGEQYDFGSTHGLLLGKLTKTLGEIKAFLGNVSTIMEQMGIAKSAVPDSVPIVYGNKSIFQKRLRGYVVIRDYKDWTERTVRDFQFLHEKYPNKF